MCVRVSLWPQQRVHWMLPSAHTSSELLFSKQLKPSLKPSFSPPLEWNHTSLSFWLCLFPPYEACQAEVLNASMLHSATLLSLRAVHSDRCRYVICLHGKMELGTGTERPPSSPATLVPGFLGTGVVASSSNRHVTVFLPSEKDLGDKPALWFICRLEEKSPRAFGFGFTHPFLGYCYDYRGSYYW